MLVGDLEPGTGGTPALEAVLVNKEFRPSLLASQQVPGTLGKVAL